DVNIKFQHFERASSSEINEQNIIPILNAIELLNIIVNARPAEWIIANLEPLQRCLDSWIKSENPRIVKAVNPIIVNIFAAISTVENENAMKEDRVEEQIASFKKLIDGVIQTGLQSSTNTYSVILLMAASIKYHPEVITPFLIPLMNLLKKLTKEMTTVTG